MITGIIITQKYLHILPGGVFRSKYFESFRIFSTSLAIVGSYVKRTWVQATIATP